jgi:DNA-damage-inducible protein D
MDKAKIELFEKFKIRKVYIETEDKWYFSVVDVIAALEASSDARNYWKVLKSNLKKEGSEVVTKINQLKMTASDGKNYRTDSADVETMLRLIQSVPSKKAEPIKLWLAKVGYERMQEMADPEKALNRSREYWQKMGRSEKWIQQRMMGQETRNKLTDYWKENGVKEQDEFAILTGIIHKEWSDLTVKEHKNLKGLETQNLRDHMNNAELIFTALAELSTRQIAEAENAKELEGNIPPAIEGGRIAKGARKQLENKTRKSVITSENFLPKSK